MQYQEIVVGVADMWSENEIEVLKSIFNQLIPENQNLKIPGGGDIEVMEFIHRSALEDKNFKSDVKFLLAKLPNIPADITEKLLENLEGNFPKEFNSLLVATYKGYYSRPDIRAKVGVGAHPVHPKGYNVERESIEEMATLTEPVRARGSIYRDPTKGNRNGK